MAIILQMRLLIIEDEPDLLRRLAKTMQAESYAVDTAADGEDGLRKALENDYDAILLDAMLPKLDGWELLERLRKSKTTPVLMLTGFGYVAWRRGWASRIATIDRELEERLNPFIAGFRPAFGQRSEDVKEPQLSRRARICSRMPFTLRLKMER